MNIEIWLNCFKGYQVSSMGRVRSITRCVNTQKSYRIYKSKILSTKGNINGYPAVNINGKAIKVHRLVAKHFVKNPEKHNIINHIDGVKTNNKSYNLEWCTHSHNIKHAYRIGLSKPVRNKGIKNAMSKIVLDTSTGIFYESLNDLVELIKVKRTTLGAKLSGQNPNNTNYKYV